MAVSTSCNPFFCPRLSFGSCFFMGTVSVMGTDVPLLPTLRLVFHLSVCTGSPPYLVYFPSSFQGVPLCLFLPGCSFLLALVCWFLLCFTSKI